MNAVLVLVKQRITIWQAFESQGGPSICKWSSLSQQIVPIDLNDVVIRPIHGVVLACRKHTHRTPTELVHERIVSSLG
jgi:hypothetical protein